MAEGDRWYCVAWLAKEGKAIRVEREEVDGYLEKRTPLWVDLLAPTDEDLEWLDENFGFHPLALSDVLNNQVRPKQELYGDVLFTVFGAMTLNPDEDPTDTINLNLFLTPAYLVTAHLKPLTTVQVVKDSMGKKTGPLSKGTDFLYYALLDGVIDRYLDVLEEVDLEIETIEAEVFGEENPDVQRRIFTTRSRLANMRRSIGPKREALRDLVYEEFPQIKAATRTLLRDVLDHVQHISDRLEAYREVLNGLMEAYMVRISNRMNEIIKILSVISTIMLPLSFVTGIFGMNFQAIPGLRSENAFWAVMAFMGILAGWMLWLFKRKRIL